MKFCGIIAAMAVLGLAGAVYADSAGPRPGPIVVLEVTAPDAAAVTRLVEQGYDISNVRNNVVTVYATPSELAQLRAAGYAVREIEWQPAASQAGLDPASLKALGAYHTYATLTADLNAYATAFPDLCRLESLGTSVQGRELWALLITNNPDAEEDEPEFKYVGSIHGDESLGGEMCLYFIDRLLNDYASDARIADLIDSTAIWIVPVMNPDGLEAQTRFNANGVDLNRSFPQYPTDFTGTLYSGEPLGQESRQPEVARIMEWTAANSFVLSANFHTGTLVVNYPYDYDGLMTSQDEPTPDDLLFEDISRRYSATNLPMWNSLSFDDGITNGADWYPIKGGMQDWNYRYASCNEVTIEISTVFKPSASMFPSYWADNEESMLAYLEAVHIGVRGIVTDRVGGAPLLAEVRVQNNEHPVFTDPDVGDYYRMLLPGTYTLTCTAPGYIKWTERNIAVAGTAATRADIQLSNGDADGDGLINAIDVQLVINSLLGFNPPYDCDIDGDGVTATDLQSVINAVLRVR